MENNLYTIDGNAAAGAGLAIVGGMMVFFLLFAILLYIFMAICFMKIAKKANTENAWFAWIPILNIVLLVQCAKKPLWWLIFFFIPFINIVATIMIWMAIAKNLGKPEWLGILMLVPVLNFVIPAYLAFSDSENNTPAEPATPQEPSGPEVGQL